MWVNKTVQEIEIVTIKEEEVVADHNQEITLEAEEEEVTEETTTVVPTEGMTSIARMPPIATMGMTHPNPRSSALPRISRVKLKN